MTVFQWSDFQRAALVALSNTYISDHRLLQIINLPSPLPPKVDALGVPLAESVSVTRHPNATDYRRVILTRLNNADLVKEASYRSYAGRVVVFLEDIDESESLFIINVCTGSGLYEFLYRIVKQSICVSKFIGNTYVEFV